MAVSNQCQARDTGRCRARLGDPGGPNWPADGHAYPICFNRPAGHNSDSLWPGSNWRNAHGSCADGFCAHRPHADRPGWHLQPAATGRLPALKLWVRLLPFDFASQRPAQLYELHRA